MWSRTMLAIGISFILAGCTQPAGPSLAVSDVPAQVGGNVVSLPISVRGFAIVAPDGDDSGTRGHFHVFVDRAPLPVGAAIPQASDIIHSAENPIRIYGLSVGQHVFKVVLGDGRHQRVHEAAIASVTVDVRGPSVKASAPAKVSAGQNVTVALTAEGIQLRGADGDTSGNSGHFHILVDPASAPQAGQVIGPAEPGRIIHTAAASANVSGLAVGVHTIWVVLGDGTHRALDPPAMARFSVTIE